MENAMKYIEIQIITKAPIVITSKESSQNLIQSNEFISGTLLRGVLAEKYIETLEKGIEPHEDSLFKEFFFGGLQFVDAYPAIEGKRSFPFPKSLVKPKKKGCIQDLTKTPPGPGFKTLSGYGTIEGNTIKKHHIDKTIRFHMSRKSDGERFAGKSIDGGVYSYESINPKTEFIGYIFGDDNLIDQFEKKVFREESTITTRVGKSKRTGYGTIEVSKKCIDENSIINFNELETAVQSGKIVFRLDTPLISSHKDACISKQVSVIEILNETVVKNLEKAFPNKEFRINDEKLFSGTQPIINFTGVWGIYNIETSALDRGTVFSVSCNTKWEKEELKILAKHILAGFGLRLNEGFGQVRLWCPEEQYIDDNGSVVKNKENTIIADKEELTFDSICTETREIVKTILKTREVESVRKLAYKDVQACKSKLLHVDNHSFARLENYVSILNGRVSNEIKDEVERIFKTNWGATGLVLYNPESRRSEDAFYLFTNQSIPSWAESSIPEAQQLSSILRIKLKKPFKEYWTSFFRYARKIERGGEQIDE